MAQPIIKKQDLLQSRPEPIYINTNPMMRLNVYENDGFDQPVKNPTFVLANSTVVLKDLDADDSVEIGTVTTAETPVSNGVQISFPLNTKVGGVLNALSRYVAEVYFDFNGETVMEPFFFNVVKTSNVYGGSS